MEGLPMLTCLIQHTLKSLCTCSSSESSDNISTKWVYAVFWRITPRIYPPPKWDFEGSVLDQAKGNKRNWILIWEDGFCDLAECERIANDGFLKGSVRFGADIFFKLSHEVYNYGEGLIGKVAAENSHKWVFNDESAENDPSYTSTWNASIDPQPKAWDIHFNSGIKTIAIISVKEGLIQLGSFDKILEDINLVISIQRRFSYLRNIPGLLSIQRPVSSAQNLHNPLKHKRLVDGGSLIVSNEAQQLIGPKVNNLCGESEQRQKGGPSWFFGSGYNGQENGRGGSNGLPFWPIPPLLPSTFESHLEKSTCYSNDCMRIHNDEVGEFVRDKRCRVDDQAQEEKPREFNLNPGLVMELGFGSQESDVKS
uniref:uncharacterized protein LOC122606862 n=1 Tax=Erigeron canadensis TaxID=72917 RepID=UPI001CB9350E|nr:uncharacterized protein LOC122606862 [Erigeron canadensis]